LKPNALIEIKKYAAIDIGSNAVRLLISNIILKDEKKEPTFKKSELIRVPIRLGADVFLGGNISDANKNRMIAAMKAFRLLMQVHGVEKYKACATSAMRDASNGKELIAEIENETGINIEIINGKKEAEIIASTDLSKLIDGKKSYLYVDVGGGSTEFTVFSKGKLLCSKSFKIGTVRLLNNNTDHKIIWKEIKTWISVHTKGLKKMALIGSGGNINKIFKMSNQRPEKPLSYIYMNAHYQFLKKMTYEERIAELGLNQDRADVIIPATKIYLSAMKWSKSKKIYVPKIGLSDGIIKSLFNGTI
jgi:exopolyphosphatase/guanosine-5'-triphosphate,3'-diphosphate pyrophosphatase